MDDRPIFDEHYYRHDCGVPYERSEHWLEFFGSIADAIIRELAPTISSGRRMCEGFPGRGAARSRASRPGGSTSLSTRSARCTSRCVTYCAVSSAVEDLPGRFPDVIRSRHVHRGHRAHARVVRAAAVSRLASWADASCSPPAPTTTPSRPTSTCFRQRSGASCSRSAMVRSFDVDVSFLTPWALVYQRDPLHSPPTDSPVRAGVLAQGDRSQ